MYNDKLFNPVECECNECEWKGLISELEQGDELDLEICECPNCGSENIYIY